MTRFVLVGLAVLWLAGCGSGESRPPTPEAAKSAAAPAGPKAVGGGEINLPVFSAQHATSEGTQQPDYFIQGKGNLLETGVWELERAAITIYNPNGPATVLRGERGHFDERKSDQTLGTETETIGRLEGGVTLESGTLRIELNDVQWLTQEGREWAQSDQPVVVTDRGTHFRAERVRYYPDEKRLLAYSAEGRLELGKKPES